MDAETVVQTDDRDTDQAAVRRRSTVVAAGVFDVTGLEQVPACDGD